MRTLNVQSITEIVLGPADSDNPTDKDDQPVQRIESRLMQVVHPFWCTDDNPCGQKGCTNGCDPDA